MGEGNSWEGALAEERSVSVARNGTALAALMRDGTEPGLVWLGGFRSDMTGSKAATVSAFAAERGLASLRFDYSGHGQSGGAFADGTISRWVADARAAFELTNGPQVLVGSSMGAWIALRLVADLRAAGEGDRIAGLVLIAPAPDFTSELMEPSFTEEQRAALARDGSFTEPSAYSDEPDLYTRALIEDGARNRVLGGDVRIGAPVRVLQGMRDEDVPYTHALRLMDLLVHDDATMTLVRDGDHRLSRAADLALLRRTLATLIDESE